MKVYVVRVADGGPITGVFASKVAARYWILSHYPTPTLGRMAAGGYDITRDWVVEEFDVVPEPAGADRLGGHWCAFCDGRATGPLQEGPLVSREWSVEHAKDCPYVAIMALLDELESGKNAASAAGP